MQVHFQLRTGTAIVAAFTMILGQCAYGQSTQSNEGKGIPARATPADYQSHVQAGTVTIAADFEGHSVATPESILSNESFVVVEVALFGSPGARLRLSFQDFSLRINGKKATLPAQQFGLVFKNLKDPSNGFRLREPAVPNRRQA